MSKSQARLCTLLAVAMTSALGLAACQKKEEVSAEPTVTVNWVTLGDDQPNSGPVYSKVNELLKEKYNLQLKFETYPAGTYDEKMNMKINSGEDFDLCFTTQSWLNKYPVQVAKGAFLALDDYLGNYPVLTKALPDFLFEQARLNGKIYAIPNYQISYSSWGFFFRKDIVDEMKAKGLDWDYTKVKKHWDAEPFWKYVKENHPELIPADGNFYNYDYDLGTVFINAEQYTMFRKDDPQRKLFHSVLLDKAKQLEWEVGEYHSGINKRKMWENGYFRTDIATVKDESADKAAGRFASAMGVVKPGGLAEVEKQYGNVKMVQVPIQKPFVEATGARSAMTAVNARSKHPEQALKMLEIMNTDKEIFNLLNFGIEGQNYELVNGKVKKLDNSGYFYNSAWSVGNQFNALLQTGQEDGIWEQTDKLNRDAEITPILGYSFNTEPVTTEIAAASSIRKEFAKWAYESDYEAKYQQYYNKIKQPAEAILAEAQKQLDQWSAANGKK
ncbi:MAG: extracellular solute-binding protein family 1 [Paenibacillaceae bacterium]|jgi:putative aldouronate transport system substrate-binding protein|nr:extracellular solute-binding protein family 1 [Paenibacillaceae bacterium]